MTYKIMIKNTDAKLKNLWEAYGTTTISGSTVTFTEFSTDDVSTLKDEIKKLDQTIGFENIRIIADVTYDVDVNIGDIGEE